MKRKIDEIWEELEKNEFSSHPLLMRGYSGKVLAEIYVAVRYPERYRCIAIHLSSEHNLSIKNWDNFKDLKLESYPDLKNNTRKYFLIILLNNKLQEIFSALSEDLLNSVSSIINEKILVKEILERLERWASLFNKASTLGLSSEEQLGLYGELYFLRQWLAYASSVEKCISAWLGPEKGVRDFQYEAWALEVKASQGNNHQRIHIASERQLDISTVDKLYLFHLSLDVLQESGETLNELVTSISEILWYEYQSYQNFRLKLLKAGYFDQHKNLYSVTGYQKRQADFYHVYDNFPRIEEKDIRKGVGDVKYSIIISDYSSYKVNESEVYQTLF